MWTNWLHAKVGALYSPARLKWALSALTLLIDCTSGSWSCSCYACICWLRFFTTVYNLLFHQYSLCVCVINQKEFQFSIYKKKKPKKKIHFQRMAWALVSTWWCQNVHQWGTRSLRLNNRCLKIRKYKETPSRGGPVWSRPNTLRRLSQKTFLQL